MNFGDVVTEIHRDFCQLFDEKDVFSFMKRPALHLLAGFLLSGIVFAAAQTPKATIEGSVTRAGTGQPLKGARVTLRPATTAARTPGAAIDFGGDPQNRFGALIANLGTAALTVSTDANGRFTITGIDPGNYQISADREGFIRAEYGQRTPTGPGVAVKLAANQRFTADLQMVQASVISGRVITPDGDPASNATAQAYTYQYSNGERTLAQVATVQTNDLGEYRLFGLEPGEYFVSVTTPELTDPTPVGTLDVSQTRGTASGGRGGADIQSLVAAIGERGGPIVQALGGTGSLSIYYPGTLDPDGATPIPVPAAAEVRSIDFNLLPARTATVSGRVVAPFSLAAAPGAPGPRGRGRGNFPDTQQFRLQTTSAVQVSLTRVGSARTGLASLIGMRFGATPVNADGSFEIKNVAPGPYHLTATARDPNGQEYTARTRVEVGSADVGNVAVTLRAGVEVRGRVVLETTPPQQFKMTNIRVSLVSEDGALPGIITLAAVGGGGVGTARAAQVLGGGQLATETVAEDGSFTLKNVGAMEYRVRVTGLPQGAYLKSGRLGTEDALNAPISVDNAPAVLQLELGFSPGHVSGTVADASGSAAAGAQVVLVPDESRRGRSDAYFTATSDQYGQFNLNNVPPGSYKLFAWEDVPAGAYQYPDFLSRYEDRGQTITVNPNGSVAANARLIPAS